MSAPSPAPVAAEKPSTGAVALRLLGVAAVVAVGFVAIWQGFGAAGYGTDAHTKRVSWACFQLIGFAVAGVCARGWFLVRLLVALAFFGSACVAWWTVRSSNFKSALSLRDAVAERDRYRVLLTTATADDIERYEGLRGINFVVEQYPTLAPGLSADYDRWKDRMWRHLTARYNRTPPDDLKAIHALRAATQRLAEVHPAAGDLLKRTDQEWVSRAVGEKVVEFVRAHGDWDTFDRTAPGRKALAEAFPEARAELVAAEEDWASVTLLGEVWLDLAHGSRPKADWRGLEKSLLARQSVDTSDGRFKTIRGELFAFAHEDAQAAASAHIDAGRYDLAFGVARKHAVDWNATATLLGADEVKKLDELRNRCEEIAKLHAERPEVAPAPRLKP